MEKEFRSVADLPNWLKDWIRVNSLKKTFDQIENVVYEPICSAVTVKECDEHFGISLFFTIRKDDMNRFDFLRPLDSLPKRWWKIYSYNIWQFQDHFRIAINMHRRPEKGRG